MKDNIKRVIIIVLAALMIFSLLLSTAVSVFAQEPVPISTATTVDGFEYVVNENQVTITKYMVASRKKQKAFLKLHLW